MAKDQRKVGEDRDEIVAELPKACQDEAVAVEFLERQRWGDSPACPHCGDTDVYKMTKRGSDERNDRWLWRCRGCHQQYTVRIGTIMEDSPIPLRLWCWAFWRACASKNGISALQIKRETGLSYKSALFMMHRIRWAMTPVEPRPLTGPVEVDETYVGGKPRKRGPEWPARRASTDHMGRGTRKQAVVALVERDGEVRVSSVADVTGATLKNAIREHVAREARIVTDDWAAYRGIGDEYEGGHDTVHHSLGEYVRGDVHTNRAESFFSLVKRGLVGTFHNVSKRHLDRYLNEFGFRWNHRKVEDGERVVAAIKGAEGKRLYYRWPVSVQGASNGR